MTARLVFLNGEKAGFTFNLGDDAVTIGRGAGQTITFPPDELIVSNQHATIVKEGGHYVLRDEGSRNGTLINAEVVTRQALHGGDLIQFGPGGPSARFVMDAPDGVAPTDELPVPSPRHTLVAGRATSAMPAIVAASPDEPAPSAQTESRRTFLKAASVLVGTLTGLLAGIPALIAFAAPLFRPKRTAAWIKLGDAGDFDTGVPNKKDIAQTVQDAWVETRSMVSVWVYTDDGKTFTIYDARCTHLGCSYNFVKDTGIFQCPCHGGRFDPKTGAVLGGPPPRPLDKLASKVEAGTLFVQIA
jgi:menaquinol-cytochrome c reductase iron-sulfur subunit